MTTDQASLLGFPNPIIGVAVFPVVAATGAVLVGGSRLPRWYWLALQAGVTMGAILVGWLFFQSLYRINALCPYCMVVWVVVLPIAWYTTRRNLLAAALGGVMARNRLARVLTEWHVLVIGTVFLAMVVLILQRFWDYWVTLV